MPFEHCRESEVKISNSPTKALESALGDLNPPLTNRRPRKFALLRIATFRFTFEHLHELLEDIDLDVQKAAQKCLIIVAPVFPSVTEGTLRRELRVSEKPRQRSAFEALKTNF